MRLESIVRALAIHWDSVASRLDPDAKEQLVSALRQIASPTASREDVFDATEYLLELLPSVLPADHPVRKAIIASSGDRSSPVAAIEDDLLMEELRRILDEAATKRPASDNILDDAVTRLLSVPALTQEQLVAAKNDPAMRRLIRLPAHSGTKFPAFQFDDLGRPLRLVLSINELLDADTDPWGAADWWLGPHAWLDGSPADLLGRVPDHVLLAAVRAMIERD